MNAERFARVQALFHEALEQPANTRATWLTAQCGGDHALREHVQALLRHAEESLPAWNTPPATLISEALLEAETSVVIGRRIGAYEVTRLIGVGGMGAVYEGTRNDAQFSMRVAIKLLRRGADSELALQRFRYERQILANLRHRNIAALMDGGVTDDGQPYFVMEYVDGAPITEYAHARRLTVRQRVQLLRQVCGAVQHAHESLVVHRDLKPGNILVTDDGTVKLLDFGIARLLRETDALDSLPATEGAMRAFTPDYASPEQFVGLPAQPSSDVYSLGVIASELLSGHRPFVLPPLLRDQQALIAERPAPAPSQLVTDADAPFFGVRDSRKVREQLHGDIDAIVLQALRKEPERRYRSAEQFNLDLQRHLDGRPVSAQRDTMGYRLSKFVRRRRVETIAVSLVAVSLVAGTVISVRAARRAERERAKSDQVNGFLQSMLGSANPDVSGKDVTVAQAIGQASRNLDTQQLTPEIESEIRYTLANTYAALSLYDSAAVHARRAYDLRKRVYGEHDDRTANTLIVLANVAEGLGKWAEADSFASSAARVLKSNRPVDGNLLASALDVQARVIEQEGRLDEAERIKRELLALRRQGTDTASRAGLTFALTNLATTLTYRGQHDEAERLQREAIHVEASVHGTNKPNYADVQRGLAGIFEEQGKLAQADSMMREVIPNLRLSLGPTHTTYLRALSSAARIRLRAGDPAGAVPMAQEVVRAIGGPLPEADVTSGSALQVLAAALDSLRRTDEAEQALQRAYDIRKRTLEPSNWIIASAEAQLGAHYLLVRRYDVAEQMLKHGYAGVVKAHGESAPFSVGIAKRLVLLFRETGQTARAAEWQARAEPKSAAVK